MKIYLDIDGVLLANDKQPALHADEFIKYLVENHDVHWLSTHCMDGDGAWACELVGRFVKPETAELLKQIKPTRWNTLKTEAIDFKQDFRWLDDDLWPDEMKVLEDNNATGNFVMVDLAKDPEMLKKLIGLL